jgi:hypothetical protein
MNIETTKDVTLRRYLLGEMEVEELETVEKRFISEDSLFDELRAVEDELYLEYSAGELSDLERSVFETKFLRTPEDRSRLRFADAFLEITGDMARERAPNALLDESGSFLGSIAAFLGFSDSALQMGMAAAVVIMAIGIGFLFVQNAGLRRDVASFDAEQQRQKRELDQILADKQGREAELTRQIKDQQNQEQQDQQHLAEAEGEREKLRSEIDDTRRRAEQLRAPRTSGESSPSPSILALALSPGRIVRGPNSSGARQITIPTSAKQLRLTLDLKSLDKYAAYRVVVSNVDDSGAAFTSGDLRERKRRVGVTVPASSLPFGDYEVELLGVRSDGRTQDLTRYYFSVVK